jgi:xanthine dehydrogenase large subunit
MDAKTRVASGARSIAGALGKAIPHESGHLHVSGKALYTDDIVEPQGLLHLAVGLSSKPHARIVSMDLDGVRSAAGVVSVITAADTRRIRPHQTSRRRHRRCDRHFRSRSRRTRARQS